MEPVAMRTRSRKTARKEDNSWAIISSFTGKEEANSSSVEKIPKIYKAGAFSSVKGKAEIPKAQFSPVKGKAKCSRVKGKAKCSRGPEGKAKLSRVKGKAEISHEDGPAVLRAIEGFRNNPFAKDTLEIWDHRLVLNCDLKIDTPPSDDDDDGLTPLELERLRKMLDWRWVSA